MSASTFAPDPLFEDGSALIRKVLAMVPFMRTTTRLHLGYRYDTLANATMRYQAFITFKTRGLERLSW